MTDPIKTEMIMTTAEALAFLKKTRGKGYRYCIGVDRELPIADEAGKCFPGYAIISISLNDAKKFVTSVLGTVLEGRGGRIRIEHYEWENGSRYVYL